MTPEQQRDKLLTACSLAQEFLADEIAKTAKYVVRAEIDKWPLGKIERLLRATIEQIEREISP